jgi:hypothetical protein
MNNDEALIGDLERLEADIAPSIKTVRTTFAALNRTVDTVAAECRAISETLDAVGLALQVVTQSGGQSQQWGGFGMIGLPIVGAIRAVQGITSQYVKQETGVPLSAWTDLVASSSAQFEAYLTQLDTVAALSQRYDGQAASEIDLEQAREDKSILVDARWRTQAWKQILSRVAQLGRLVDAVLKVDLSGEPRAPEGDGPPMSSAPTMTSGFSGSLQRRLKEVQSRTTEKSGDLRAWVLQPFVDVRDRVKQLPGQTAHLSEEIALLEVLLDLEVAEIRACLGEISPGEVKVVGIRVATAVTLPELGQRLATARQRTLAYETYLARLDDARNAGTIDERVYSILSEEYRTGLADSRIRLADVEAEADVWRRDGPAVLEACAGWTRLQLDVLTARSLTEHEDAAEHRALLQRERDRVDEARKVLATL